MVKKTFSGTTTQVFQDRRYQPLSHSSKFFYENLEIYNSNAIFSAVAFNALIYYYYASDRKSSADNKLRAN
jgi:hypothetical protein